MEPFNNAQLSELEDTLKRLFKIDQTGGTVADWLKETRDTYREYETGIKKLAAQPRSPERFQRVAEILGKGILVAMANGQSDITFFPWVHLGFQVLSVRPKDVDLNTSGPEAFSFNDPDAKAIAATAMRLVDILVAWQSECHPESESDPDYNSLQGQIVDNFPRSASTPDEMTELFFRYSEDSRGNGSWQYHGTPFKMLARVCKPIDALSCDFIPPPAPKIITPEEQERLDSQWEPSAWPDDTSLVQIIAAFKPACWRVHYLGNLLDNRFSTEAGKTEILSRPWIPAALAILTQNPREISRSSDIEFSVSTASSHIGKMRDALKAMVFWARSLSPEDRNNPMVALIVSEIETLCKNGDLEKFTGNDADLVPVLFRAIPGRTDELSGGEVFTYDPKPFKNILNILTGGRRFDLNKFVPKCLRDKAEWLENGTKWIEDDQTLIQFIGDQVFGGIMGGKPITPDEQFPTSTATNTAAAGVNPAPEEKTYPNTDVIISKLKAQTRLNYFKIRRFKIRLKKHEDGREFLEIEDTVLDKTYAPFWRNEKTEVYATLLLAHKEDDDPNHLVASGDNWKNAHPARFAQYHDFHADQVLVERAGLPSGKWRILTETEIREKLGS